MAASDVLDRWIATQDAEREVGRLRQRMTELMAAYSDPDSADPSVDIYFVQRELDEAFDRWAMLKNGR